MAWSSDGSRIYSQCNNEIKILEVTTGTVIASLAPAEKEIDEDTIYCFNLSHNGQQAVTAHKSGLIKMWSTSDCKVIKMWRSVHNGPIARISFNNTGDLIATGGSDGTIRIWNITNQTCTACLKGATGVFSVIKFHPTEDVIYGVADDTVIRSWNLQNGKEIFAFKGHFSIVTSLSITYDGKYLVSSGRDRVLILWDIILGKIVRTLPIYESIEGAVLLPIKFQLPDIKIKKSDGGIHVACAGEKGNIKIWDITRSKLIYEQKNSLVSPASEEGGLAITQILFNDIVNSLCIVSVDHNILIYDLSKFECTKQMIGFTDEILDMVLIGKEEMYAAVATNSADIKIYHLDTMDCYIVKGHTDIVLSLSASSSKSDLLLSASKDNTIRLWSINPLAKEFKCIATGARHTASVGSVCLPHISSEFCFSVGQDSCIKRWVLPKKVDESVVTLNSSHTELAHTKDINCVTISPNDKIVATGSQDKTIKLWGADDLSNLGTLRGHKRGVWCVRFSPTDQVLLSTSADCTIKLWSISELSCLKTFEGHESSVLKAEFMSRGLQIASAGADGLLKIWNIKTSESTASLDKHDGRLWALAVSRDENIIITGGSDSLLVKWKDVTVEKKEKEAKERDKLAVQEQELSNLLRDKKLIKALKLALRLEKPLHVLRIINEILKNEDDLLTPAICELSETQQEVLLNCCLEWNTNTKNCEVAQNVLYVLLSNGCRLGSSKANALRSLLPYTKRHLERLTNVKQDIHFLSYTIKCMQPYSS